MIQQGTLVDTGRKHSPAIASTAGTFDQIAYVEIKFTRKRLIAGILFHVDIAPEFSGMTAEVTCCRYLHTGSLCFVALRHPQHSPAGLFFDVTDEVFRW